MFLQRINRMKSFFDRTESVVLYYEKTVCTTIYMYFNDLFFVFFFQRVLRANVKCTAFQNTIPQTESFIVSDDLYRLI